VRFVAELQVPSQRSFEIRIEPLFGDLSVVVTEMMQISRISVLMTIAVVD
jgi:hypothetical protein